MKDTIYLQIDNGDDSPITWSEDSIYESDIEYIKADKYKELEKKLEIAIKTLEEIGGVVRSLTGEGREPAYTLKQIKERSKITCSGAGKCDHSGIGCDENNNCGEYVRKGAQNENER